MRTFTNNEIKSAMAKKNYEFFKADKPFHPNIIGVRANTRKSNSFDDFLYLIYYDQMGHVISHRFAITTDAGKYNLENPVNSKGTAILVPDQYVDCYAVGLHRGQYRALCQIKSVKVYRDNNKDDILDMDANNVEEGIFGINIHRSNPYSKSYVVEKWSAGCQVFQAVADFVVFMSAMETASLRNGNKFTYTLLEEKDFS